MLNQRTKDDMNCVNAVISQYFSGNFQKEDFENVQIVFYVTWGKYHIVMTFF